MKKTYTGINIQFPISQLIISGEKTIETRTYPIPNHLIGQEVILIETPGKTGNFKARMIALIRFGESFQYESKGTFYKDTKRHCVVPDSVWAWVDSKPKWGWPVKVVKVFKNPLPLQKRSGIKYSTDIEIPSNP